MITKALLPEMRERKWGRLIYIGSIFGLEAEASSVIQSTLRAGLNAFAKCIATEFAVDGITSNVICPGYFDTPLVRELAAKYADESKTSIDSILDSWRNFAPCNKFGKPEDLASLIAFLSSPKAEFINGTTIVADGGAIKQY
jgi:NAD(P)-dependent dehydrogenase (short-subunit alcohol dehydrogenase family)